nr:hypothetical protein GCM10020093_068780 [Planobispora longispora]
MATAVTVALLASSGGAGALAASGPRPSGPDGGLARFEQQKITWHRCQADAQDEIGAHLDAAGARCAEVTVPLDHSRPDGPTVKVAISRLQATDPGRRRGALLINPGGPGDPGRVYAPLLKAAEPTLAARYDLIGMDPRFTGRSTPVNCQWPIGDYVRSTGHDRRGFGRIAAQAEDLAARCAGQRELLPHASARATARDMDVIRAALGESKLSYLGGSYGTYLGAVYMQLFPARVDRFVLDSALDPAAAGPGYARSMGPYLAAALKEWAAGPPATTAATAWAPPPPGCWPPSTASTGPRPVPRCGSAATGSTPTSSRRSCCSAWAGTASRPTPPWPPTSRSSTTRPAEPRSPRPPPWRRDWRTCPHRRPAGRQRADGDHLRGRAASRDAGAYYRDIRAHRADEPCSAR